MIDGRRSAGLAIVLLVVFTGIITLIIVAATFEMEI